MRSWQIDTLRLRMKVLNMLDLCARSARSDTSFFLSPCQSGCPQKRIKEAEYQLQRPSQRAGDKEEVMCQRLYDVQDWWTKEPDMGMPGSLLQYVPPGQLESCPPATSRSLQPLRAHVGPVRCKCPPWGEVLGESWRGHDVRVTLWTREGSSPPCPGDVARVPFTL